MEYDFFGNSGLYVGKIGIGTLTWGRDTDPDDARLILRALRNAGGNLIDISPAYGEGNALSVLGTLLTEDFHREDFVLCAHAGSLFNRQEIISDCGRASLIRTVDQQLKTLHTDYLDLLIINGFNRADGTCPIPLGETLDAVQFLLRQGKIRYYALHGFTAWEAAIAWQKMLDSQQTPPIGFAAQYSLLNRDPEEMLIPFTLYSKMGLLAFAPLAGGVLTGKYRNTIPPTSRAATPHLAFTVDPYLEQRPRQITQAVAKAADGLGRTPADISFAWLLAQPGVKAVICGPRTANQAEQLFNLDFSALPQQVEDVLTEVSEN